MFFYASKIVGYFLQPSAALILLALLGTVLLFTRFQRSARLAITVAVTGLAVIAFTPLGFWLLAPLEERIPRINPPSEVHGIIVLGGSFDNLISTARGTTELHAGADRITESIILARRYPDARLIFSGGHNYMIHRTVTEAGLARRIFSDLGLEPHRLVLEDRARNTHENAVLTKQLLQPLPDQNWLLVTSAFHMPRSLNLFRKAGWQNIYPWPTDYRTRGTRDIWRVSSKVRGNVDRVDLGVREWIGLIAYWLTGRTDQLFPSAD